MSLGTKQQRRQVPRTAASQLRLGDQFVMVGPTRVRVRIQGEAVAGQVPLVLIMGIGANLDVWHPLSRRLTGRQLVMFDFPGLGQSDLAGLPPTMPANAMFLRFLLGRLGVHRADVLGFSWGGLLAQQFAIQYPSVVRRLVLASTMPGLGGLPTTPVHVARMVSAKGRAEVAEMVHHTEWTRPAFLLQLVAAATHTALPMLPFVGARTLVIGGDQDSLVPTVNQRVLAGLLPHVQLEVIKGGGHLVLGARAAYCAKLIGDFLAA